jgi:hypothetical protein
MSTLSPTPTAIPRDPGFTVDADGYDPVDPERKLISDLISGAINDYRRRKPQHPTNLLRWQVRRDSAERFLFAPADESNFEWLAYVLGMDPEEIRSGVLSRLRNG